MNMFAAQKAYEKVTYLMSAGAAPAINDSLADYHCHLQQPRPILMKHIPMVLLRLRRSNRNVCTAVAQLLTKLM